MADATGGVPDRPCDWILDGPPFYLNKIQNLERSVMEALSIRDQALASMDTRQMRAHEAHTANRELRGAQELWQEDLTRAQLEEVRALHAQQAVLPLTPEEEAERRIAMESEARSALTDAKAILNRALRELTEHARMCPIRDEIFIAPRGRVWHLRPDCRVLVNQATDERIYQWCTTCASMEIPPNSGSIRTLKEPWRMTSACFWPTMEMFCNKLVHATSLSSCRGLLWPLACNAACWFGARRTGLKLNGLVRRVFPSPCVNCTPCNHVRPFEPSRARSPQAGWVALLGALVAKWPTSRAASLSSSRNLVRPHFLIIALAIY